MSRRVRRTIAAIGLLLVAFGLACLNYTKAAAGAHHEDVAARHRLPPPCTAILYGGTLSVIAGSAALGFVAGRRG